MKIKRVTKTQLTVYSIQYVVGIFLDFFIFIFYINRFTKKKKQKAINNNF